MVTYGKSIFCSFDLLHFVLKGNVGGFHLLFHIPIECKIDVIILHMVMWPVLCGAPFYFINLDLVVLVCENFIQPNGILILSLLYVLHNVS